MTTKLAMINLAVHALRGGNTEATRSLAHMTIYQNLAFDERDMLAVLVRSGPLQGANRGSSALPAMVLLDAGLVVEICSGSAMGTYAATQRGLDVLRQWERASSVGDPIVAGVVLGAAGIAGAMSGEGRRTTFDDTRGEGRVGGEMGADLLRHAKADHPDVGTLLRKD